MLSFRRSQPGRRSRHAGSPDRHAAQRGGRPEGSPALSSARIGVAAVIAALLAWQVLEAGSSAISLIDGNPAAASRLAPDSADAWAALAQQQLTAGDADGAKASATRALVASPVSASAIRTLALGDQQTGDLAATSALMGQATALGWRDAPTQLWTVAAARAAGDNVAAAMHADAIFRTVGKDAAAPLIDELLADPAARRAMVARLALRPGWRELYFTDRTSVSVDTLRARGAALLALAVTAAPASFAELRSISNRLADAGSYADAAQIWHLVMPATASSGVIDGGFDRVPDDAAAASFFQWRLSTVGDASARVERAPNGGSRLRTSSDGGTDGVIARQMLVLAPGAHQLAMSGQAGQPRAGEAFRWDVACLPSYGTRFWATAPASAATAASVLSFTVPPSGCAAQQLELRAQHIDPPAPIDTWFDNVSVR